MPYIYTKYTLRRTRSGHAKYRRSRKACTYDITWLGNFLPIPTTSWYDNRSKGTGITIMWHAPRASASLQCVLFARRQVPIALQHHRSDLEGSVTGIPYPLRAPGENLWVAVTFRPFDDRDITQDVDLHHKAAKNVCMIALTVHDHTPDFPNFRLPPLTFIRNNPNGLEAGIRIFSPTRRGEPR